MATTTTEDGEERPGEEFRAMDRRLAAAEVRELSRLDSLNATLWFGGNWLLLLLCIAAAIRWPHPLLVALAVIAIALLQHGLAVLLHEAAHYRLYPARWLNDLAGKLCGATLGVSMVTYRVIHRTHHNHLYEAIDPDLALMAGYPRGRLYLVRKLLKDLTGITTFKNYFYFVGRPQGQKRRDDTSALLRRAARRDRRIVLLVQLALLAIMIATGWWRWYLLLWLLPAVTVLQMILRLRAICEHGAVGDLTSPLTAARTTLGAGWARWLLFPHHVNYHIEHHLYPSIPHFRLAECHRRLRAAGALEGAEVVPSIRGTLGKIFADPKLV